jgi:hypothetical protein
MTIDELKDVIHKADLILHPYALYVNPINAEQIRSIVKDMEQFKVIECDYMETGKVLIADRNQLENYYI